MTDDYRISVCEEVGDFIAAILPKLARPSRAVTLSKPYRLPHRPDAFEVYANCCSGPSDQYKQAESNIFTVDSAVFPIKDFLGASWEEALEMVSEKVTTAQRNAYVLMCQLASKKAGGLGPRGADISFLEGGV
jgi:hypothetical protein